MFCILAPHLDKIMDLNLPSSEDHNKLLYPINDFLKLNLVEQKKRIKHTQKVNDC
jgi:hypothetical protein